MRDADDLALTGGARPAAKALPPRRPMRRRNKILLIFLSLILMALLRQGFVFFLIGMLPSVVVYYLDQSPHRYTFKTIFCCNMSGMLPFLGRMLYYGPTSNVLQEVMGSATTWFIIYGAAGIGWLLINFTPLLANMLIGSLHQTQISRLQRAQKKIENEWGKEVTQFGVAGEAGE